MRKPFVAIALLYMLQIPLAAQETRPNLQVREVTFRCEAPEAAGVALVGDFNSWNEYVHVMQKNEKGVWTKTLHLRTGKVFEYAFAVDGRWIPDPSNPVRTMDDRLSVVYLPGDQLESDLASGNVTGSAAVVLLYKKLDSRLGALQAQMEALQRLTDRQAQEMARKDSELGVLRNETAAMRIERNDVRKDQDVLREKMADLEKKNEELAEATGVAPAQLEVMRRELNQARNANKDAQARHNTILQEKELMKDQYDKLAGDLAQARKGLEELQTRHMELTEEIREKNEILRAVGLSTPGSAPPPPLKPLAGEPIGSVDAVSPESNLLVVSAGKESGVTDGDTLVVLREGKIVGRLIVETAYDHWSSAVAPEGFDWRSMKKGDQVAFERK